MQVTFFKMNTNEIKETIGIVISSVVIVSIALIVYQKKFDLDLNEAKSIIYSNWHILG